MLNLNILRSEDDILWLVIKVLKRLVNVVLRPLVARVLLFYFVQRGWLLDRICVLADLLRRRDHSDLVSHAVTLWEVRMPAVLLVFILVPFHLLHLLEKFVLVTHLNVHWVGAVSTAGDWNLLHALSLLLKSICIRSLWYEVAWVHMLFVKKIKVLVQFLIIKLWNIWLVLLKGVKFLGRLHAKAIISLLEINSRCLLIL